MYAIIFHVIQLAAANYVVRLKTIECYLFLLTQSDVALYWMTISLVVVSANRLISTGGRSLQHSVTAACTR
jgi:hypothetical protein